MNRLETHGVTSTAAIRAVREIIRRGILTIERDPSPYARLGYGTPAYARQYVPDQYADAGKRERFVPTARDRDQSFVVLTWLQWLGIAHGSDDVRRLTRWAYGVPNTRQADREGVSSNTIMNRIDRSVAAIIERYFDATCRIEVVEEPWERTPFAIRLDDEQTWFSSQPQIMTVFVYGKGMMRNGKRWDDGRWKLDRMKPRKRGGGRGVPPEGGYGTQ